MRDSNARAAMAPGLGRRVMAGLAAGGVAAAVDHAALRGAIDAVTVVALLLAVTAACGAAWRWRGWVAAASAWACLPLTHAAKHLLGLPGTLQPDTWDSIGTMAAFTAAVTVAGFCGGVLLRSAASD